MAAKDSYLYDLLEKGDSLMADKCSDIVNDLPEGVSLNIPPFLRGKNIFQYKRKQRLGKLLQFAFMFSKLS